MSRRLLLALLIFGRSIDGCLLRAALYARYSSENQRKESIEDQLATCRVEAATRGLAVLEPHVYADHAQSGASQDRPGLLALLAAAKQRLFDVVLVDDLSRLARANLYMLITLSELSFHNVRVISVADGLDSSDKGSKLAIQFRGIINELALSDLSDRTHRGQRGQKDRGFDVGERTYGYQPVAVGEIRIDKRGRPRPDGYKKRIDPAQAAIIVRIFEEFVAGVSIAGIARGLTEDGVPTARPQALGWSYPRFPASSIPRSTLAAGPGTVPAPGVIHVQAVVTSSSSRSPSMSLRSRRPSESFRRLCGMRHGSEAARLPGLGPKALAADTAVPRGLVRTFIRLTFLMACFTAAIATTGWGS